MKKTILITFGSIILLYLILFCRVTTEKNSRAVGFCMDLHNRNQINIARMESFYNLVGVDTLIENKTLKLFPKKTTIYNIFYKNTLASFHITIPQGIDTLVFGELKIAKKELDNCYE